MERSRERERERGVVGEDEMVIWSKKTETYVRERERLL